MKFLRKKSFTRKVNNPFLLSMIYISSYILIKMNLRQDLEETGCGFSGSGFKMKFAKGSSRKTKKKHEDFCLT